MECILQVNQARIQNLDLQLAKLLGSYGDAVALDVEASRITYYALLDDVTKAAGVLRRRTSPNARVGILAQRTYVAFVGILATVLAGRAYVPLNPKFPAARLSKVLELSKCEVIVIDPRHGGLLNSLVDSSPARLTLLTLADLIQGTGADDQEREIVAIDPEVPAYIMFTSGTTGQPKGVPITRKNLVTYLNAIRQIAPLTGQDSCSQFFDLSFDLSVHDIFHTLTSGARLCVPAETELIDLIGFTAKKEVTVWFSVPSVIAFAKKLKRTKPNALPQLRLSLFCGEALPMSAVETWLQVAPSSRIINLYGPTEATIAILEYEVRPEDLSSGRTIVPLGRPIPGSYALIRSGTAIATAGGESGEIVLGGDQVSTGYLNDPSQTATKFITLPDHTSESAKWYLTGDLGVLTKDGQMIFLGRLDEQIKINGFRVELLEIEAVLRTASGSPEVAAAVWMKDSNTVEGVVGFVCNPTYHDQEIIERCRVELPTYACPRRIISVPEILLNANGKTDRQGLLQKHLSS